MGAVSHVKSNAVADWTGTVTVGNSAGGTQTIAATDLVRPVDWNSAHNQFYTLAGNTNNASTASGTNVQFSGNNRIVLIGSTDTIGISADVKTISSYAIGVFNDLGTMTAAASTSHGVSFYLPNPISVSFCRFPVMMTTNSTTIATTASSRNFSAEIYSTWNVVVYSLGVGGNSRSLQSVASGSAGFTQRQSISVAANGTQYSISQQYTYQVEGNSASFSTGY